MDLQDFLKRLHVDHGPSASGEYVCRCPAHDDSTASLCVKQGDKGILVDCKAGCDTKDVLAALKLAMKDLFPEGSAPPAKRGRKPNGTGGSAAVKTTTQESKPRRELGQLTKVYTYTDESGKAIFEVCRYELDKDGEHSKTFLQRYHDPKHPQAKPDGYVWSTKGLRHPLYRLHEVVKAIQEGKPIYVVEGEKDADNLAALGLVATTNPGGASKKDQQTKWTQEHTDTLAGADVIILPDIDETGMTDRQKVAGQLVRVCKSVRLVDLTKGGVELPEKGDITDFLKVLKTKKKGLATLAKLVADTPVLNPADYDDGGYEAAIQAIDNVSGYCVKNGCICKLDAEGNPRRLCTFLAVPRAEIIRDDGVNTETIMLIDGWNCNGMPLPQVRTSSKGFNTTSPPEYEAPELMGLSIEVKLSPRYREGRLDASNRVVRRKKLIDGYDVEINLDQVREAVRDRTFGRKKDANGVQVLGGGDPETCAIGFAITKDNNAQELWWLYKGQFAEQEVSAKTGTEKIDYQTPKLKGSFDSRMDNGRPGVVADTDDPNVPASVIEGWFKKVYEPTNEKAPVEPEPETLP